MVKRADADHSSSSSFSSSSSSSSPGLTTAQDWYDEGEHVWYDPESKEIISDTISDVENDTTMDKNIRVFCRIVRPSEEADEPSSSSPPLQQQQQSSHQQRMRQRWMTFLPNAPEGSYGFHKLEEALASGTTLSAHYGTDSTETSQEEGSKVETDYAAFVIRQDAHPAHCTTSDENGEGEEYESDQQAPDNSIPSSTNSNELARLYLDYMGHGDSEACRGCHSRKSPAPEDMAPTGSSTVCPASSTKQHADLVEAHWHAQGIQRTVVVSVGETSSLVVMELLQRQRARLSAGTPFPKIMHVLAVNGRYVAKTRHTSQLAAVTQLLRSDRVGSKLASKAQQSDFTLWQCIVPYLRGLGQHASHGLHAVPKGSDTSVTKQQQVRHVRQQVMEVVRRHNGASRTLQEMARTVDDHLEEQHKYRWHLPRLYQIFGMNQGITFTLATTHRLAQRQTELVQKGLEREYQVSPQDCPGMRYEDWNTSHAFSSVASSAFLLGSTFEQLKPFLAAIHRLANEEIPLSDNSYHHMAKDVLSYPLTPESDQQHFIAGLHRIPSDDDDEDSHEDDFDDDSYQLSESDLIQLASFDHTEASQDTRLETEIVFDADDCRSLDDDWNDFHSTPIRSRLNTC